MLTRDGDLKLVDLGVTKLLDDDQSLTQTGQAIGTPWYLCGSLRQHARKRADVLRHGATSLRQLVGQLEGEIAEEKQRLAFRTAVARLR